MVGSLLTQNKSIGDTQNENHHLLSPSELHPPQVVERNGLLMACAASASRIRPWPVRRSSLRGGALSRTESRTTMTSIFGLDDRRMGPEERHSRQQRTSSAIELIKVSRS